MVQLVVSSRSPRFLLVFSHSFLFLFLRLDHLNWSFFKLTDYFSASSNLFFNLCSENFICYCAFQLKNFSLVFGGCFVLLFLYFIDILYIVDIVFILCFLLYKFLDKFSISSLKIFIIVDLKSLSSKSNIWASSGIVLLNVFLPYNWAIPSYFF